jgi:dTDP-4-dehydrorhamnose reductase
MVVTGVTGQLGGSIHDLWKERADKGWDCLFPDRLEFDLTDEPKVREYIRVHQPSIFLHAAAYTNVEAAEEEDELAFLVNGEATTWIAEECSKIGCWLIFISTDYVFNGEKGAPYSPEDEVNPMNVYGQSKLLGEQNALQFNLKTTVVRVSWLYSTKGKNFFKTMLSLASTRNELNVVDDQYGAPTYARVLAKDLLQMIAVCKKRADVFPRILHYSPQGQTTWNSFAKAILQAFYPAVNINAVGSGAFPQKAKRPAYSKMSSKVWEEKTGIIPLTWEEQLNECIEDWKKL